MSNHLQNPSYYRSHHYAHQFNLPDSAFLNRKLPVYASEMPQGVNPFIPSHKKHFQRLGYQSIITQEHLINHQSPQQTNSPANNKNYYRNLSIEDIEGASTNTLISQALKNRIKAKEYYLKREKQRNLEESGIRLREATARDSANKQAKAEQLIKRYKNEANYHEKYRAIKTEQSSQSPPLYDKISNYKIDQCRNDLERTEKEIYDLQRRLQFAKKRVDQQKPEHSKKGQMMNMSIALQPVINEKQPSSQLKLPKIDQNQYKSNKNTVPYEQLKEKIYEKQRKRSYTQPNEPLSQYNEVNKQHIYPNKDYVIQKQPQRGASSRADERLVQSRLRRQEIRKLNPTYLSYGSFSGTQNPKMVYL